MDKIMRWFALLCGVMGLLCAEASAQVTLNYQGQLMQYIDFGSNMLFWDAVKDTTVSMTFKLYLAPSGGTAFWTETRNVTTDFEGVYSVQLGSVTPLYLASPGQYWLGVKIASNAEMSPRMPITPAIVSWAASISSMQMLPHSAEPALCTSPMAGVMALNSTYTLCFCNGESWRAVGYGSPCRW